MSYFIVKDWTDSGTYIRPEVAKFAIEMERVLKLNDHKGGWKKDQLATDPEAKSTGNTIQFFRRKLREETTEVHDELALESCNLGCKTRILRECADVANIAMMIADNWGGLLDAK